MKKYTKNKALISLIRVYLRAQQEFSNALVEAGVCDKDEEVVATYHAGKEMIYFNPPPPPPPAQCEAHE